MRAPSARPLPRHRQAAPTINRYRRDADLVAVLAERIAQNLRSALAQADHATLAVSGGSTPRRLFAALSRQPLDWSRVLLTQVDERWVGEQHRDSNARLIREQLLVNAAAAARFLSMKTAQTDVFAARGAVTDKLAAFAAGADVLVLGMGDDGHTASFFPDSETLASALDPASTALCEAVRPPRAAHDRMTLTLACIVQSRHLYLHIAGASKQAVLAQALQAGQQTELPIRAVLDAAAGRLQIFAAEER